MADRSARTGRRRPFSALMKKLANLKAASEGGRHAAKRNEAKKIQNNPYQQSGRIAPPAQHSQPSIITGRTGRSSSRTSLAPTVSVRLSTDGLPPPTVGGRSMAPTVSTDQETSRSMMAPSHRASSIAGTSRTAGGGLDSRRGGDSTFSSPAPSVRSLTTTLTTIQSLGPNQNNTNGNNHQSQQGGSQVIHFDQPFPTTSPASAIPAHLTPAGASTTGHPTTYATATANNLLTDNASILTLASSSKRRRRRSFDTDASVRALAPSSLWGGSRESLPLSVLSANMEGVGAAGPSTPGLHRGASGMANERTSIYSATGILASERNSIYAKQVVGASSAAAGDAASIRSGLLGHGRAESISGSIGGPPAASPLASPREVAEDEGSKSNEKGKE
ncbi:hypothetical protein QBC34DRAFT_196592 [Podospora aff. communis PSN243]|uniref:Uncharacterized protein n=1 Tax=Podospora aff. communis PSN243 TaxID=3040156 RepID=A0AAV9G9W5_9PEZI|nr:hypothetical protein QBC34DRAFT_196592 [Podospora aff. communis PSN243]